MATPTTKSTALRPGYEQTEVGVIPEDWAIHTGEAITDLIGKGASPRWQGYEYSRFGMLFITSENVRDGYLDLKDPKHLPLSFHEKLRRTQLRTNDILVNLVGGSIGRSCRITLELGAANVNQAVAVFRVKPQHHSPFVAFYFQAPSTVKRILDMQADAARPNISLGDLRRFHLPLPTSVEQAAIAKALSHADASINALQKLIAKKRDLKQAAMQQLLTGKKRLPGFQGEWERKLFGELFAFSGGYSASRAQLTTEGHRYLHYGDIHTSNETVVDVDADHGQLPRLPVAMSKVSPASLLSDGDVVFVDASEDAAGTSKHVVVKNETKRPFISGLHTIVAKQKMKSFCREYLCHCFQTHDVRRQFLFYAVGTKVSGVSKGNIGKIEIPVPHISEQTAIAEVLNDMDSDLEALEAKLAKARQIKQGMMQELLTGKIRLV